MAVREIKENIYSVGVIDWDRRLFDELIPLPQGTSYNAYLIKGNKKTALIDTVDPKKSDEFLENLSSLDIETIDYIIVNHAEQDHSGSIPIVLEKYSSAKLVTNQKCADMLKDLLSVPDDKIMIIEDAVTLDLGGKTLEFIFAPWVHWPETLLTYLREDKILFPCDLFGSHLATSDLFAEENMHQFDAAKRYYAEIMMPFRNLIKKHLVRLAEFDIDLIASSHGPIYEKPEFIIDAYKEWVSDESKNEVIIPYVSMHGSVEKMVNYLEGSLAKQDIKVRQYNLIKTDLGELAMSLVDATTIILAAPMVLAGPHPSAVYTAYLVNALRPKVKHFAVIGSYGWGGKLGETLLALMPNIKAEILNSVLSKGYPKSADLEALDNLAKDIAAKHKALF